ncbi:MAG: pilus assembly protein TadG-related protein [Acidobacteriaceae bacterium]|jgi:hypothetical protein|nr:pilus assembly protein TadG-related protein [Acidobacteriaceae bacterium]
MRRRDERGVILIQVALIALTMLGLAAFVVDLGAAWTARAQAQTAADAGALAGAISLEFDDATWPALPPAGAVVNAARTTAQLAANQIMGASGAIEVLGQCPPFLPAGKNENCIRVNVYRDGTNGSTAISSYFARVFGIDTQPIRATATAQVMMANSTGCMRPWFIVDRYIDTNNNNKFDPGIDVYTPPGWRVPDDVGQATTFYQHGGPSSYGQLDIGSGGNAIRDAIQNCAAGYKIQIGDVVATKPGANVGPETQGMDALMSWDPNAHFDPTTHEIVGSCAPSCSCSSGPASCPYGGQQSPRIVQAAVCAPTEAACDGTVSGSSVITVINLLSFFITGYSSSGNNLDITAVLLKSGGDVSGGGGSGSGQAGAFVTAVRLVQ